MSPETANSGDQCPVDHKTREKWLEAAKAKNQQPPAHPLPPPALPTPPPTSTPLPSFRFSLDTGRWQSPTLSPNSSRRKNPQRLSTDREISTIPRAISQAIQPSSHSPTPTTIAPANSESDTGHDFTTGNWIYPSQAQFFAAMRRKGHTASPQDMSSIVPIHNAVNERAWSEILAWERAHTLKDSAGAGAGGAGEVIGPKLVSFAGDSKKLTPRARWNVLWGYTEPFDRHDWVVERPGGETVEYVIDFYAGKGDVGATAGQGLNFYLDVRPKMNTWEGIKTRVSRGMGL